MFSTIIKALQHEPVLFGQLLQQALNIAILFGLHLTNEQTIAIMALFGTLTTIIVRAAVTPNVKV